MCLDIFSCSSQVCFSVILLHKALIQYNRKLCFYYPLNKTNKLINHPQDSNILFLKNQAINYPLTVQSETLTNCKFSTVLTSEDVFVFALFSQVKKKSH